MKYYNRRNEELLGAAERAAVAADWLGAKPYDRAKAQRSVAARAVASVPRRPDGYEHRRCLPLFVERRTDLAATGYRGHDGGRRCAEPFARHAGEGYARGGLQSRDLRPARSGGGRSAARRPCQGVAVYAPSGRRVAAQILSREGDRARILFAADVKAAGYAVYDVRPASGVAKSSALKASERTLENRIYRVEPGRQRRYPLDPRQACRPRAWWPRARHSAWRSSRATRRTAIRRGRS